jgi:hypothetical protein
MSGATPPLPNTPSWRGAQLKHREDFILPSVEVKNAWSYTSTPQYVFMVWYFVKHSDNFTSTLSTPMIQGQVSHFNSLSMPAFLGRRHLPGKSA